MMKDITMTPRLLMILLSLLVFALPASAHKVVMSAYAEGSFVEGEVGFSNGDMAANVVVEVLDDDGKLLGQTKTDADGIFQYTPDVAIPLTFKANLGQGHIAIYRMATDELPETGTAPTTAPDKADPVQANDQMAIPLPSNGNGQGIDQDKLTLAVSGALRLELVRLESEIAAKVRKEVKPLRKEIASYKEKNNFQTILGGIGYIIGLFGIGFYIAARRERQQAEALRAKEGVPNE